MEDFGEQADVVERLRALGREPVDPVLASAHLTAMAGARTGARGWTKLKVGAAFLAGLLLGGTGLASAGALPDPVQDVARSALKQVGIDVPPGHQRYDGPECGKDADGQPFRNHGQYVRANKDDPDAAGSRCGKPLKAGQGGTGGTASTRPPGAGPEPGADACRGRPPWAGNRSLTAEQKAAAQAARAACPDDVDPARAGREKAGAAGPAKAAEANEKGAAPQDQPTASLPATGRPEDPGRPGAGGQGATRGNADESPGRTGDDTATTTTTTAVETTTTTAAPETTTTSTLGG